MTEASAPGDDGKQGVANARAGLPRLSIAATVLLASLVVVVAAAGNPLAAALFQVMAVAVGVVASYAFGKNAAAEGARDVLRPHARNAFRLLLSLFRGLQRIGETTIDEGTLLEAQSVDGMVPLVIVKQSLRTIQVQVLEQISTADNAVAGWQDILPEEVAELTNTRTAMPLTIDGGTP